MHTHYVRKCLGKRDVNVTCRLLGSCVKSQRWTNSKTCKWRINFRVHHGYLEKSQSQRLQIAARFVFCIFYPIQIDLVQDSSLSVGIFGIWRRLFGTCFNSFSPVPNDKLDFASTVWTQPLTSSCFGWFLLGSFCSPDNHKTMSQAAKPSNAMWMGVSHVGAVFAILNESMESCWVLMQYVLPVVTFALL